MLTTQVALREIDLHYDYYKLFDTDADLSLESSISALGLLNPVKLIKKEGNYVVITGWKRLNVLNKLNAKTVYSQVFDESELSLLTICTIICIDNRGHFTEIEKAELLNKLHGSHNLDENKIISEFLPLIGLKPSLNNLKKYLAVSDLEHELKLACINDCLSFEQLQLLSEIEDSDFRKECYHYFLENYKFNNNETRDLLKDLRAICISKNQSVCKLAENILNETNGKPDKNTIRKKIKTICYPRLTETEEKFYEMVKGLNLGDDTRLVNHPYFESNDLELRIKFKDQNELIAEIEKLRGSLDEGKIQNLLKLIKEGI